MVTADSTQRRIATIAPWRISLAYLVAVAGTVATFYSRLALGVEFNARPLLFMYFIPMVLSAYIGGLWPSLVSTAVAASLTMYFLFPPYASL